MLTESLSPLKFELSTILVQSTDLETRPPTTLD